ncbi:MAG: universal stress protein [Proteobacteria bacterium]|nr:universal stress protein [Pseudomonadota bacterium]
MRTLSRILAATDFSAAGNAALARAGRIAAQQGAELRIIHATPDWTLFSNSAPMAQQHYTDISKNAGMLLNRAKDRLAAEFSVHVVAELHQGKASQAIARCVTQYQPGMLVLGAHGEHTAGNAQMALGATTMKLVSRLEVPLLLVRREDAKPYNTSVAAIGPSSEQARRIVHWATAIVSSGDCHIVRTYEVPYLERLKLSGVSPEAIATCYADAEMAAKYAANPPWSGDETAATIHMHLVRGTPLPTVLAEVARHAAQVVVIGRHEQTPLAPDHPLMGCIGTQIAYHCPVDVLMIP